MNGIRLHTAQLSRLLLALFSILLLPPAAPAHAEDPIIYMAGPQSGKDPRGNFKLKVLNKIVEVTKAEDGPLEIKSVPVDSAQLDLELGDLVKGDKIQVAIEVTKPDWEKQALPVFIPVDKGLVGWKIGLIRKESQPALEKIQTIEELKKVPAGVAGQWASAAALEAAHFNYVTGSSYDGLFEMLMAGRFDIFLRGVNSIYAEYDARKADYPDLAVEDHIAVVIRTPQYIFVTPRRPELAKRLKKGMQQIQDDGTLDAMIKAEFGESLMKIDLAHRKVFYITNPNTTPETAALFADKRYWYQP
jgi:ABC-type amino acid transport substrate-binding protein